MSPKLFGILNMTEDSFSDGGRFLAPDAAIAHGVWLSENGADIVDIGAASSNPDAAPVPEAVEIGRLVPVVAALKGRNIAVSVDSFSPAVQRWAIKAGVDYINDIQGFPDSALYPDLARSGARLVVMHSVQGRGRASRIFVDADEIMDRCLAFFARRLGALKAGGIAHDRVIIDPGMGFFLGSDPKASLAMLNGLPRLKAAFGLPVLVSVSRKSFLRNIAERTVAESGSASLAGELYAALQGADCLRTHDPGATAAALRIWKALESQKKGN